MVTTASMRVLFISGSPGSNTLRYRVRHAEEALRSRGALTVARHFTDASALDLIEQVDVLALYRVPAKGHVMEAVRRARAKGIPVTYDVDDLVFRSHHLDSIPFLDSLPPAKRATFAQEVRSRARVIRLCDSVSGTTRPVVNELSELTSSPVTILPNGLSKQGVELASAAQPRTPDGRIRLGYFSGSATHEADWRMVEPAVLDAMSRLPHVDLWLVGPIEGGPDLASMGSRVSRMQAVDWRSLPALVARVDINLAPLDESPFTQGKSAIKWLEAAAVGVPTIATPTDPFSEAIDQGSTGMLAPDLQSWSRSIGELATDQALRTRIGRSAQQKALDQYGPNAQAERYSTYFRDVVDKHPIRVPPALPPAVVLEHYEFTPDLQSRTLGESAAGNGRRARSRLRSMLRSQGQRRT